MAISINDLTNKQKFILGEKLFNSWSPSEATNYMYIFHKINLYTQDVHENMEHLIKFFINNKN